MSAAPYSIPDIISIAAISQVLAFRDIQRQNFSQNQSIDKELPMKLYMERAALQYLYDSGASAQEQDAIGAYVFALCGGYAGEALGYLGISGGQIINPSTGLGATMAAVFYVATVDGAGTIALTSGQTEIIIPDQYVQVNSIEVVVDAADIVYGNYTDRLSYTVIYTDSNATINIYNGDPNQGLQAGWIIMIRGQKFVSTS